MEEKRLVLIKFLLKFVVERYRQEEEFIKKVNDIKVMYNIDISPIEDKSVYDVVPKEELAEEIYEFLTRTDIGVDELVEEFCEKYKI
jgi:hypothetical protein